MNLNNQSHLQIKCRNRLLVESVSLLSQARTIEAITQVVRGTARQLVQADGATFVFKDQQRCFYADEDAISPLWKGRYFPINACISGWSMIHKQQVMLPDIYADDRIPQDSYRATFVKSMVMTPVCKSAPIAAIGTYWATPRTATEEELSLLQALADTTAVAIENVYLYRDLEKRVEDRTRQLQAKNEELQMFATTISHDLRGPLLSMQQLTQIALARNTDSDSGRSILTALGKEAERLATTTDALLSLCKLSCSALVDELVDISQLALLIGSNLRKHYHTRQIEFVVQPHLTVRGDSRLMHLLLENLLSNAWKYTGKTEYPRIEVGQHERSNNFLTLYVRDNGCGFDSTSSKLFHPFHRFHSSVEFPGNGVGLAAVKTIVARYTGNIRAESSPGHGASIYFTLPTIPLDDSDDVFEKTDDDRMVEALQSLESRRSI